MFIDGYYLFIICLLMVIIYLLFVYYLFIDGCWGGCVYNEGQRH